MKDATEKIRIARNAQLTNLLNKLRAGKPLTAGQMAFVEREFAKANGSVGGNAPGHDGTDICSTASELATRLGIDRRRIAYHRKRPDAPQNLSESEWRTYLTNRANLPTALRIGAENAAPKAEAQARQISLQNEKLEFQIKVLRREFVPALEVEKWGAELGGEIRKTVMFIPKIAPSLAGLSPADIEIRLQETADEILNKLHVFALRVEDMKQVTKEAAREN